MLIYKLLEHWHSHLLTDTNDTIKYPTIHMYKIGTEFFVIFPIPLNYSIHVTICNGYKLNFK